MSTDDKIEADCKDCKHNNSYPDDHPCTTCKHNPYFVDYFKPPTKHEKK